MSATFKDILKITDKHGFTYEVNVEHHPEIGLSVAFYRGDRISRFEYGRYLLPQGDDGGEWEQFEERFRESSGGDALVHFEISCKQYFSRKENR